MRTSCHSLGAEVSCACPFSASLRPHYRDLHVTAFQLPLHHLWRISLNLALNLVSAHSALFAAPRLCHLPTACFSHGLARFLLGSLSHSPGSLSSPVWKSNSPPDLAAPPPRRSAPTPPLTHPPTPSTPTHPALRFRRHQLLFLINPMAIRINC